MIKGAYPRSRVTLENRLVVYRETPYLGRYAIYTQLSAIKTAFIYSGKMVLCVRWSIKWRKI